MIKLWKNFTIIKKNLNDPYKQIEDAHNTSVVAEHFCNDFQDIEEIGNIRLLVKLLPKKLNNAFTQTSK